MSEALKARVFDRDWKYVPAGETDIRKLFARVREQIAAESKPVNVKPIRSVKGK